MKLNNSQKALSAAGGNVAVARAIGISPPTVWRWGVRDLIPAEHVKAVADMTGGLITASQIRPDLAEVFK